MSNTRRTPGQEAEMSDRSKVEEKVEDVNEIFQVNEEPNSEEVYDEVLKMNISKKSDQKEVE